MDIDPDKLDIRDRYALLIGAIVPRPIAWVSTVNENGVTNLAPFSFFTGVTANPMSVCFCPVNNRDGIKKDTLLNVERTKEFVVNMVNEDNLERVNATSAAFPYGVSEFERVGLTQVESLRVRPPRVKETLVSMECKLIQVVTLGAGPLGGHLVIGKVVMFHADDKVWNGGKLRHQDLKPVGRMEGSWYARTQDAFELSRPEVEQAMAPKEIPPK